MSGIDTALGANATLPVSGRMDGYKALHLQSENRGVSLNGHDAQDKRQRMAPVLSAGQERSLIDKTKDIAASLFNTFRTELGEALQHIGIRGDAAAKLVRDVSESFVEAVRSGSSFSSSMIAAAYKETLVQSASSVSHSLEFSAKALSIDYNHATGELTADTSKLEIDAVRVISGENLPSAETAALFDFTDSDGPPSIAAIFDRVQQYLASNGFIAGEGEDGADGLALTLPDTDEALYDAVLIDNGQTDEAAEEQDETLPTAAPLTLPLSDKDLPDNIRIRAIEEFTNERQETITRMTLDLMVRVHMGKDADDDQMEMSSIGNMTNETLRITA